MSVQVYVIIDVLIFHPLVANSIFIIIFNYQTCLIIFDKKKKTKKKHLPLLWIKFLKRKLKNLFKKKFKVKI